MYTLNWQISVCFVLVITRLCSYAGAQPSSDSDPGHQDNNVLLHDVQAVSSTIDAHVELITTSPPHSLPTTSSHQNEIRGPPIFFRGGGGKGDPYHNDPYHNDPYYNDPHNNDHYSNNNHYSNRYGSTRDPHDTSAGSDPKRTTKPAHEDIEFDSPNTSDDPSSTQSTQSQDGQDNPMSTASSSTTMSGNATTTKSYSYYSPTASASTDRFVGQASRGSGGSLPQVFLELGLVSAMFCIL